MTMKQQWIIKKIMSVEQKARIWVDTERKLKSDAMKYLKKRYANK